VPVQTFVRQSVRQQSLDTHLISEQTQTFSIFSALAGAPRVRGHGLRTQISGLA